MKPWNEKLQTCGFKANCMCENSKAVLPIRKGPSSQVNVIHLVVSVCFSYLKVSNVGGRG